jgi:dUTP pyrophosphatase
MLKVKLLSRDAKLPSRATPGSAGLDIYAAHGVMIASGTRRVVKTDVSIAVPMGTYGRLAPRSGLAFKHGIDVCAGVIDADYRGPLGVVLSNHSDTDFVVTPGDRVAQLIIEQISVLEPIQVEELDETTRGAGGFGSTG